jgi:hypothetical protein
MGTQKAPADGNRHPAGTQDLRVLSLAEWARREGRSGERARQVVALGHVPNAIPICKGVHQDTWVIPEGTPWPLKTGRSGRPLPPPGFVHVTDWAKANGRNGRTVSLRASLGQLPEAKKVGMYWFVPEGMAWPLKPQGRPRNPIPQGEPSGCSQGAGESRGGRPALEAA